MDIETEREFCSNFSCCDMKLSDLHELFDHLENYHEGSELANLPFAAPCSGSSTAFSEFFQLPVYPATPPPPLPPPLPLSSRKKHLFTRVPLPTIPPVSPTASESSISSSVSASPSPTSSDSGSDASSYPSAQTRDKIYTPVAIPPTLRMDQSKEGALPCNLLTPPSYLSTYTDALGPSYLYGDAYRPPPALVVPLLMPLITHTPIPLRPQQRCVPPHAEVIDVDLIPSPSAPPHADPEALPLTRATLVAATPLPASSPAPPPPVADAAIVESDSERPRSPPAKRHCGADFPARNPAPFCLTSLRRRFPGRSIVARRTRGANALSALSEAVPAPLTPTVFEASTSGVGEVEMGFSVIDAPMLEDCEGDKVLVSETESPTEEAPALLSAEEHENKTEALEKIEDPQVDSEWPVDDADLDPNIVPSTPPPISSFVKPPLYLKGREKLFVCPIPECIKAYLNPNGLIYHAKKGTCVMENGDPCPQSLTLVEAELLIYPPTTTSTVTPSAMTSESMRTAKPRRPVRKLRQSARLASGKGTVPLVATTRLQSPSRPSTSRSKSALVVASPESSDASTDGDDTESEISDYDDDSN
ncbi:hypothetical protein C8R43DRAFT_949018 [Mycena crocata]|nr:hypothetical protein C8R43DRAFT_949018 [Mycena crocata]